MIKITLSTGNEIVLDGKSISTDLKEPDEDTFNAAVDGLESFLLALHCAGVDVDTPQVKEALEVSIEALANNL